MIRRVGGSVGPADLLYWKREPLVLTSGLLDSLPPGFRAPRWYGIEESDDAIWIWMEDAPDTIAHPWSLERFALAARHLGAFNGAYLAGRPLPDFPWLNRGLLANYLDQAEKDLPFVSTLRDHPLVRRGWPGDTLARMWELWGEKANLIAALARLPQTLCHADAQDQNLVGDGSETVALDWAWTGVGAVGEELAVLLRSRLRETDSYAALDAALFPSYLAGLREAGWCGDERLVRLGYTVTIALRYALNCVPVRAFEDDALRVRFEESLDWPLERIVDWLGALRVFALDRADEARALIQATA